MNYVCVDRGSEKCPCILMEAGQCYTCGMIQRGNCDCQSQWQGVCPYTEYHQRNKKAVGNCNLREFTICEIRSYTPTLSVISLHIPLGYGLKCRQWGAFVMAKWKEWFIPLSVLNVDFDYEKEEATLELAVNATGPKTIGLLKESLSGEQMKLKGPFYSGLLNVENTHTNEQNVVVAKGVALMPLINMKEQIKKRLVSFRLDTKKLSEEFKKEYLNDIEYVEVNLEKDLEHLAKAVTKDCDYCLESSGQNPNIFLMMSPYYVNRFLEATPLKERDIIQPNHSNMCCGEGFCGSCSFSDEDGVTVRLCKCIDK